MTVAVWCRDINVSTEEWDLDDLTSRYDEWHLTSSLAVTLSAGLVPKLFPRKSNQSVLVHVLPVVWSLIGSAPSAAGGVAGSAASLRSATSRLVGALHLAIGDSLLDAANNTSSVTLRARQNLRQIIDSAASVSHRRWNISVTTASMFLDLCLAVSHLCSVIFVRGRGQINPWGVSTYSPSPQLAIRLLYASIVLCSPFGC